MTDSPLFRQHPRPGSRLPEKRVDSLVADLLLVIQSADVRRDERLDAMPESARRFPKRHAGSEPGCRSRVPAVVDPERGLSD